MKKAAAYPNKHLMEFVIGMRYCWHSQGKRQYVDFGVCVLVQVHIHINEDKTSNLYHWVWSGPSQWLTFASTHLPKWPQTQPVSGGVNGLHRVAAEKPSLRQQWCHTRRRTMCWMSEHFSDHIIPSIWSRYSRDCNPLAYFAWSVVEAETNQTRWNKKDQLKEK